jgi:hypothetical protein
VESLYQGSFQKRVISDMVIDYKGDADVTGMPGSWKTQLVIALLKKDRAENFSKP